MTINSSGTTLNSNQYTNGEYLEKTKDWHQGDSYWKAHNILDMIQKHELQPKSLYDVGCGAGAVLTEIEKHLLSCSDLQGFDISPQAIAIANSRENSGVKFNNENFLESQTESPDLLLILDVFEHVSDYRGFLDTLRKKTNQIIFHIPLDIAASGVLNKSDYMLSMFEDYGHLHFFTRESALMTLKDLGYKVIDYSFTDDRSLDIPWGITPRLFRWVRNFMFRVNPGLTASIFRGYNLLVLAEGDLATK